MPHTIVPESEDQVHLRPILGIRAGVYLAVAFSFVILVVLFFLLLYPGIAHPGALVVFTSEPRGAALRLDDAYIGTSPCRVFVPRGEHSITVTLPGFAPETAIHTIPSRVFASLLFPRHYPLSVGLKPGALSAGSNGVSASILAAAAYDYASWTFGGEPTATWQIPLSLSEGVYRAGAFGENGAFGESANGMIAAAARFATTRAALRDLVRARALADNGGNVPSPLSVIHSVARAAAFLADNPGSAAWLADTLPHQDSGALLISSAWYQNQLAAFADSIAGEALAPAPMAQQNPDLPANQIRLGGLLFIGIGAGTVAQGEPFPHQKPVEALLMCTVEVPVPAYADFLDAVPRWRSEQRDSLAEEGLVTNEYLVDYGSTAGGNPINTSIRAVSWYAAEAFCEWLSGKLPDSFAGWELRLPTEAEWEYAAKSSQKWQDRGAIFSTDNATPFGSTWEWCADPYSPLPFLSAPPDAVAALGSPERSLRSAGASASINIETRASLPPSACSPFVSFRPVIARKGLVSH